MITLMSVNDIYYLYLHIGRLSLKVSLQQILEEIDLYAMCYYPEAFPMFGEPGCSIHREGKPFLHTAFHPTENKAILLIIIIAINLYFSLTRILAYRYYICACNRTADYNLSIW